jgi:predicted deacylase
VRFNLQWKDRKDIWSQLAVSDILRRCEDLALTGARANCEDWIVVLQSIGFLQRALELLPISELLCLQVDVQLVAFNSAEETGLVAALI